MSNEQTSNGQTITNAVAATVIAAFLIWAGQAVYSALFPDEPLRATVSYARVIPPPQQVIEALPDAGCDAVVPFGDNLQMMQSHDARIANCAGTVREVLDSAQGSEINVAK